MINDSSVPIQTPRWLADACGGRMVGAADQVLHPLRGVGIDTRGDLRDRAFVAIRGPRHDGHEHLEQAVAAGARCVVVEEGDAAARSRVDAVPVIEVPDTRRALTAMARAWRQEFRGRVIGVTGSCGKTTTKRLVHAALGTTLRGSASPKSFNNDLGVPLTLLAAAADDDYVVVELGTNRPGEIAALAEIARPHVGVITLIGHSHLAELGSLEGVAAEKASLLDRLAPPAVVIVKADHGVLETAVAARRFRLGEVITFGEAADASVRLSDRRPEQGGQSLELADGRRLQLRLEGKHNALNALAAVAVADRLGVPFAAVAQGIAAVEPDGHRGEIRRFAGFEVLDDSYNANPDSMEAALHSLAERAAGRPVGLVLGDMLELGSRSTSLHHRVGMAAASLADEADLRLACFVGDQSRHAMETFAARHPQIETSWYSEAAPEIGAKLSETVPADGVVLLKGSRGIGLERVLDWIATPSESALSGPVER